MAMAATPTRPIPAPTRTASAVVGVVDEPVAAAVALGRSRASEMADVAAAPAEETAELAASPPACFRTARQISLVSSVVSVWSS